MDRKRKRKGEDALLFVKDQANLRYCTAEVHRSMIKTWMDSVGPSKRHLRGSQKSDFQPCL